jgi:hypothetical protein
MGVSARSPPVGGRPRAELAPAIAYRVLFPLVPFVALLVSVLDLGRRAHANRELDARAAPRRGDWGAADRAQRFRLAWLRREQSPPEPDRTGRERPSEALGAQVARDCVEADRRLGRFVAGVERARSLFGAFAEASVYPDRRASVCDALSSYAVLDLPLALRNNVLPQFGQALRVEAAVFSSWVASHLEHT